MHGKELHDFLFQLYDYADDLAGRIQRGDIDDANDFLMIVFIEKYFDRNGRRDIREAAKEAHDPSIDPNRSISEAHRRIDVLRSHIDELRRQYNFDEFLEEAGRQIATEWRKPQ